jgi:hypothetical protein
MQTYEHVNGNNQLIEKEENLKDNFNNFNLMIVNKVTNCNCFFFFLIKLS